MSDTKSRVKVISKLTTVSSRPVGSGKTHPFTALDRAMGLHSVHAVFYYKANMFNDFDLDPIRVSLSDALSLYPPVTGRIVRNGGENWEVSCNDAGVRVLRARVEATLDEWLRSADGVEEKDLTVWEDMPEDPTNWSPFRIQVSEFKGGGIAIGVSTTHMQADLTCVTLLLKSWTDTHRNRSISYPPIYSDPPLSLLPKRPDPNHFKPSNTATYYARKSTSRAPTLPAKMETATFKFSHSAIESQISKHCPAATPFDLLAALFWTRVTRLKSKKIRNGSDHPSSSGYSHPLSICTDTRGFDPGSLGHYGNALHFSLLDLEEVESADFGDVAIRIRCHVEGIGDKEVQSGIEWLESRGRGQEPGRMYGPELTCVSMEHMVVGGDGKGLMYLAGFGGEGGEPVHVSYRVGNVEGEGLIIVSPSPSPSAEGRMARVVAVTLPEEELGELCEDEVVLGLEPQMLLCGCGKKEYKIMLYVTYYLSLNIIK